MPIRPPFPRAGGIQPWLGIEAWQWQPTLTAHDPNPPIILGEASFVPTALVPSRVLALVGILDTAWSPSPAPTQRTSRLVQGGAPPPPDPFLPSRRQPEALLRSWVEGEGASVRRLGPVATLRAEDVPAGILSRVLVAVRSWDVGATAHASRQGGAAPFAFPTQYAGLRVYYGGAVRELCMPSRITGWFAAGIGTNASGWPTNHVTTPDAIAAERLNGFQTATTHLCNGAEMHVNRRGGRHRVERGLGGGELPVGEDLRGGCHF